MMLYHKNNFDPLTAFFGKINMYINKLEEQQMGKI